MKIKTDFVTNSSSTSFIVWGRTFRSGNILNNVERMVERIPKDRLPDEYGQYVLRVTKEYLADEDDNTGEDRADIMEVMEVICDLFYRLGKELKIKTSLGDYDNWEDEIFVGVSPVDIPSNVTMDEFKPKLSEWFDGFGLPTGDIEFIELAWRDG